jgi:DNA-binding NtrC family response regulator
MRKASASESSSSPSSRKGTILVIDDEEIMREILETLLTRASRRTQPRGSSASARCRSTPSSWT